VLASAPSAPGDSKILEHFAVQHIAFPVICLLLALRPWALTSLFKCAIVRWWVALVALVLILPEALVSLGGPAGGDLFRPYPFDLHSSLLAAIPMANVAGVPVNVIQVQHLLLNHLLLAAVLVTLALQPSRLRSFVGPRTGATTHD
jgi:hypothetical protein